MFTIKVETHDPLDQVLNDEAAWPLDGDIKMEVEDGSDEDVDWSVKTSDDPNSYEELMKKGIFTCEMCPRMFLNRFKLMQHKVSHLKVKLSPSQMYECAYCCVIYVKKASVEKHIRSKHQNPKTFDNRRSMKDCRICNKTFKYRHWHEHMRNVHNTKALWSCNLCSKKFKCERYLLRHRLYVHGGKRPQWRKKYDSRILQCPECTKAFKTDDCLRLHVKNVHTKKEPVTCEICSSVMKCENYLYKHMKRFHSSDGRVYSCKTCMKIFNSSEYLKRHIRSVHQLNKLEKPKKVTALKIAATKEITYKTKIVNKPEANGESKHSFEEIYECSVCTKKFTNKYRFNRHMKNLHSEIGTFTCKICSAVMKCERYLKNHISKVHFDDGQMNSCTICCKNFKTAQYWSRHMRKVHDIDKSKPNDATPKAAVTKEITQDVSFNHLKLGNNGQSFKTANRVRMVPLKKEEIFGGNGEVLIDLCSGPVTSVIEFPLDWEDM